MSVLLVIVVLYVALLLAIGVLPEDAIRILLTTVWVILAGALVVSCTAGVARALF